MIAVLDCGTNTFNLAIARVNALGDIVYAYNDKIPVKLGEGGIDSGFIAEAAFNRGIQALINHKNTINNFQVTNILAIGTAALRDARNGALFLQACFAQTGIQITLITGEKEAEFIWLAAKTCVPLDKPFLVMDIGGGSNEFIVADKNTIYWKKSYRLGVSRLKEKFSLLQAENNNGIDEINAYLKNELHELFEVCKTYNITTMIGTAGSFDTYANVFSLSEYQTAFDPKQKTWLFDTKKLIAWCSAVSKMSMHEQLQIEGIPEFRREFMPYSCALTATVLENCNISETHLSTWSLKEGIILDTYPKNTL